MDAKDTGSAQSNEIEIASTKDEGEYELLDTDEMSGSV